MENILTSSSIKRIIQVLSDAIKSGMGERDSQLLDSLKQHVVTPLLHQIYKDMVPYAWVAAGMVAALVAVTLCMLFMQMMIFCRVYAGGLRLGTGPAAG